MASRFREPPSSLGLYYGSFIDVNQPVYGDRTNMGFFLGGYTTFTKNYVGFVSQNDVYGIPVYHKIAVSILGYQIFRQSIYI